jgi:hypothetical protein
MVALCRRVLACADARCAPWLLRCAQFTCRGVPTVEQVLAGLDLRTRGGGGGAGVTADGDVAATFTSSNGACRDGRWFLSAFPFQIFTSFLGFVVRASRACFVCKHAERGLGLFQRCEMCARAAAAPVRAGCVPLQPLPRALLGGAHVRGHRGQQVAGGDDVRAAAQLAFRDGRQRFSLACALPLPPTANTPAPLRAPAPRRRQLLLLDEGAPFDAPPAPCDDDDGDVAAEKALAARTTLVWRARTVHLVSLLHAVALAFLRDDLDVKNLVPYRSGATVHAAAALLRAASTLSASASFAAAPDEEAAAAAGGPCASPRRRCGAGAKEKAPPEWISPQEHDACKAFLKAHPLHNVFSYNWGADANRMVAAAVPLPVLGGVSRDERDALAATPERVRLVTAWLHRHVAARAATRGGFVVGASALHCCCVVRCVVRCARRCAHMCACTAAHARHHR